MTVRAGSPRLARLRYGRVAASLASTATLVVAVLGGTGLLGQAGSGDTARAAGPAATATPAATLDGPPGPGPTDPDRPVVGPALPDNPSELLPRGSGTGKRVVFSESRQRVWLVAGDDDDNQANDRVLRTYLVSGSLYDNVEPGTFDVYSRSEKAWGIDDSGTMRYFVRFARGDTGAAIGFHDIPIDDGEPVQTRAELGTPQSHGCIRQLRENAVALWGFAPVGTTVVVTG